MSDEAIVWFDAAPWRVDAACLGVDPVLFFPDRGAPTSEAKRVCAGCAVRDDCLEFALVNYIKHGIWGGKSEKERRVLRAQRFHERTSHATSNPRD